MDKRIAEATGSMVNSIRVPNNQYSGMVRGIVVSNDDTEFNRGRCKVFVPGVYPEKFKENDGELLPWCEPCQPLFCGGGGDNHDNGTFQCPDVGSTVWMFFENSDITRPVMFGQTTDRDGIFDTDICKVYWEGMYIELDKSTHTITASAENITAVAERELNGYAETATLTSVTANVSSTTINVTSVDARMTTGTAALTASASVDVVSPITNVTGNVHVAGNVVIDGNLDVGGLETVGQDSVIGGKSFITHVHQADMGPTSPPL